MKSALNNVYKTLLLDSGMDSSPFERLPTRKASTLAQRPFTQEEYERLLANAKHPWKEAIQIAWWTGMRKKDVFQLRWSEITGDMIRKLPAKTARFRREVLIPIHPELQRLLDSIEHKGKFVLTCTKNDYDRGFNELLKKCGIIEDESGTVNFNCLRNSFISRCDAAGIPRHAIRGIVGHVSDTQTDLYSHDETSARLIQTLPK
jgi:integrase